MRKTYNHGVLAERSGMKGRGGGYQSSFVGQCWGDGNRRRGARNHPALAPYGEANYTCTANEGPVRIQYKCLAPIYVFPEIKLLFPKQNYNILSSSSYTHTVYLSFNTFISFFQFIHIPANKIASSWYYWIHELKVTTWQNNYVYYSVRLQLAKHEYRWGGMRYKGRVELKQVYGLGLTLKNMNYGFKCSPGDSKA